MVARSDSPSDSSGSELVSDSDPPQSLSLEIVEEGGDWSCMPRLEVALREAATALARHPRCKQVRGGRASIALSSDEHVQYLNRTYRGHDKATNVLSFPYGGPPDPAVGRYLGDIILADATVRREAAEQGIDFIHHVQHLVVHGVLHLIGFRHDTAAEAREMEGLEAEILSAFGIADPYAERTS
jgi:probable rRNA maturation factor